MTDPTLTERAREVIAGLTRNQREEMLRWHAAGRGLVFGEGLFAEDGRARWALTDLGREVARLLAEEPTP